MTNEMKENIIKYLTGNIEEETPSSSLEYETPNTITTNLETTLNNEFLNGYTIRSVIEGKNINGNTLNYNVMYGIYTNSSNETRGFILIIDEKGNIIQLIKTYSSGADIGNILSMKVDEEGYFYMVEINPTNDKRRFVMLNNIVLRLRNIDEFKAHIRQSYQIPDTSKLSDELIVDMTKAVGQAKYLIGGTIYLPNDQGLTMCVTELVINVGMENVWTDYVGTQWIVPETGHPGIFTKGSLYGIWTDDSVDFILLTNPSGRPEYIVKYYKDNDIMSYRTISSTISPNIGVSWNYNYMVVNMNLAYLSYGAKTDDTTEKHNLYSIDLENEITSLIYEQEGYYNSQDNDYCTFKFSIIDGELVFSNTYCDNSKCHIEIGRLRNDDYISSGTYGNISTYEIAEIDYSTPVSVGITFVNKQFNLYNYNILLGDTNYNGVEVYNQNNYNGIPFEDNKCLLPNSGKLYDENNNVVFARNLYNKTLNGGTTVSTLEVPNMYANDITIAKQDLLSYNNNILIDNEQDIITNVYETLNINFINEISMINENNEDDPVINPTGATRLNNSISANVDYTNAKLGKVRMNYDDDTTFIKSINKANQISTYVYQYIFSVYVPLNKNISSIDLISEDGYTIYATIETPNLIKGKTYQISQNVEIQ